MQKDSIPLVRLKRDEESASQAQEDSSRNVASVFPREAKRIKTMEKEKVVEMLGGNRFVSASKGDDEQQAGESGSKEDDIPYDPRPLAEILAHRKQLKDEEFEQQLKLMKRGTRGLDEDDVEYLDELAQEQQQEMRQAQADVAQELSQFQRAVQSRKAQQAEGMVEPRPSKGAGAGLDAKAASLAVLNKLKQKGVQVGSLQVGGDEGETSKEHQDNEQGMTAVVGSNGKGQGGEDEEQGKRDGVGGGVEGEQSGGGGVKGTNSAGDMFGLIGEYSSDSDGGG